MIKHILTFCLAIVVVSCVFSGTNSMPELDDAERIYQKNKDDIQIIVDYMINSGYTDIQIRSKGNLIWADFEDVKVDDRKVVDAINNLVGNDYIYIFKDRSEIVFLQWRRFNNIGVGIVYSVYETSRPQFDYPTTFTPMQESGWYYYVENSE